MKHLRKFLAINGAICLTFSLAVTAYAATARTPKANGQNKNLWCWATSAKVVAEHNGGSWIDDSPVVLTNTSGLHSYDGVAYYGINTDGEYTADGVQHAILMRVKGSDANNGGDDAEKEEALSYAARRSVSVGTFGTNGSTLSTAQIQTIKDDLADGNYVIGNLVASGFGGHSVVIKDYNATTNKYKILDPWDLTDMYYSSSVLSSASFPIEGCKGMISWIQYCR